MNIEIIPEESSPHYNSRTFTFNVDGRCVGAITLSPLEADEFTQWIFTKEKSLKHKHAELMKLYAEDAMETAKPWERWEVAESGFQWGAMCEHPRWDQGTRYRRRPDQRQLDREAYDDWCYKTEVFESYDAWKAALQWERNRRNDGKRD